MKIEDFMKMDIRIGTIIEAEKIKDTNNLLKLIVDIGSEKRQIVAGIAKSYKPEELKGKQICVLANLEPKKIKGVESRGMLLAADNTSPVLLTTDKRVNNGTKVR